MLALAIFLPHLVWQIREGWPLLEFVRATQEWMPPIPPLQFLSNQILTHHPATLPIWLAGIGHLLPRGSGRSIECLGVTARIRRARGDAVAVCGCDLKPTKDEAPSFDRLGFRVTLDW